MDVEGGVWGGSGVGRWERGDDGGGYIVGKGFGGVGVGWKVEWVGLCWGR